MCKLKKDHRVLFLASSAPRFPGDPTAPFILNMARDLSELGWQVEILAPHAHGLKKSEVIDGVAIRRFQYLWPPSWQNLCYNGGIAVNLKKKPLRSCAIPFLLISEFLAAAWLTFHFRPAVIHSHWVIPQGVIGRILTWFGFPHVISVHGADIYGFKGRLPLALKSWALRGCAHVVANSTSTRREVLAICSPAAISIIPTGAAPVSLSRGTESDRAAFATPGHRILLYVGRLIEAKGIRYLIESLPMILQRLPVALIVVGEGPERRSLEQLAEDLRISDKIKFIGAVPHSRINEYFAVADAFVGPSIDIPGEWTEAQGNTFVEALFARVPVVASRVGGIPDAIIDGKTGILVEQRSPEQIASAVLRVLTDEALAIQLAEEGYAHALKHFSRGVSASRLDSIYRSLIDRSAN